MKVLARFGYVDPTRIEWDAPAGSIVDGASIPRFAWSIIGGPFEGKYRDASVVHDVACDQRKRPWESVHEMFYSAMRASGVGSVLAKTMYAAVYHFGPRWPLSLALPGVRRYTVDNALQRMKLQFDPSSDVRTEAVRRAPTFGEMLAHEPEKVDLLVRVRPPKRDLRRADFENLKKKIERRERSTAGVMSLEEIRRYAPAGPARATSSRQRQASRARRA
jgi:hypothetical protein